MNAKLKTENLTEKLSSKSIKIPFWLILSSETIIRLFVCCFSLQKLRHCVMAAGISLPESPKRLDSSALDGLRGIASLHVMVRS